MTPEEIEEIVAFLTARIGEDEQVAQAAIEEVGEPEWIGSDESGHAWRYQHSGVWGDDDGPCSEAPEVATTGLKLVQRHIARHDPARVLREVKAKRRILARHAECGTGSGYCDDGGHDLGGLGCGDLRDLAAPFSGEPGYDERWAV